MTSERKEDLAKSGKQVRCPIAAKGDCENTKCSHYHKHQFRIHGHHVDGEFYGACRGECKQDQPENVCELVEDLDEDWVLDEVNGVMINVKV